MANQSSYLLSPLKTFLKLNMKAFIQTPVKVYTAS
jgi:hypothetical protein